MPDFRDIRDYVAIPRLTGLRLAPDGSWLAAVVQARSRDGKKFVGSIWRIDPGGGAPARLTRSAEGESSPRFLADGSLLFLSARPDPACLRPARTPPQRREDRRVPPLRMAVGPGRNPRCGCCPPWAASPAGSRRPRAASPA